jgi:uracil-DNA glycosylase
MSDVSARPTADGGEAPASLAAVADAIQTCRRCGLWANATRGVPGEGPAQAPLMLVGEQPGDQEDLQGHPFVGPAGGVLDRALADAGIDRRKAYVTNAVKHFKNEPRGKRRLHKTPDRSEVVACRWWLDDERRLLRPRVIVAMGGTAVLSVFGKPLPIMKSRGRPIQLPDQTQGMVTIHPSYLLRMPEEADRRAAYAEFVRDLKAAHALLDQGVSISPGIRPGSG